MASFVATNIVKEFSTPDGPLRILDEVNIAMNRGENLAVTGPSGSGKSTFLHIAGTLDTPTSGSVVLDGQNPEGLREPELARYRNENIGFVFQDHHLLPQLTAIENVLVPAIASSRGTTGFLERAKDLLEAVGLADRMEHRPSRLSGGERQRVAVARSLICSPTLVLADEPTGSLDQNNAESIGALLIDIQKQNETILICVTHSEKLATLFQKRVELQDGKFVEAN